MNTTFRKLVVEVAIAGLDDDDDDAVDEGDDELDDNAVPAAAAPVAAAVEAAEAPTEVGGNDEEEASSNAKASRAKNTCSRISAPLSWACRPMVPVAQKEQALAQPTCEETHTVCR